MRVSNVICNTLTIKIFIKATEGPKNLSLHQYKNTGGKKIQGEKIYRYNPALCSGI